MTTSTPNDLAAIGSASEIEIATLRRDGTARSPLPIWVVRVGDELFVRSFHGPGGSWFRQAIAHPHARISVAGRDLTVRLVPDHTSRGAVDEAYRTKYGGSGFGAAMTTPAAAATTLRLERP